MTHFFLPRPSSSPSRTEIVHVWNDGGLTVTGPTHSAQLVLDGVAYLTDAFASVGAQPTNAIRSWVTDKIRPAYWRPDSEIIVSALGSHLSGTHPD